MSTTRSSDQQAELRNVALRSELSSYQESLRPKPKSAQGAPNQEDATTIVLSKEPLNEESDARVQGTHVTPVPRLANKDLALTHPLLVDATGALAEVRGITLDCLGGDVVAELAEEPQDLKKPIKQNKPEEKKYPYTNSNKPFYFFNQTDLPVTAFLRHVVRGEIDMVRKMLDANPSLVLYKGQAIDYSGRTIYGTAYQMALGAEDVNTGKDKDGKDKNDGMAELIRSYFVKAKEFNNDENAAYEEMDRQFEEQFPRNEFPEYYERDEKNREKIIKQKNAKDPDLKELDKVAEAILKGANDIKRIDTGKKDQYGLRLYKLEVTGECANALQAFREYLKPKGVIKKGKHFNAQLLIKALEKYVGQQYRTCGTWDSARKLLFWRQVIGYIERYLPASTAQAFCTGLNNVTAGNQPLRRDLELDDKSLFFPLDIDPLFRLGFDFSVASYTSVAGVVGAMEGTAADGWSTTLMSNKNSSLSGLCCSIPNPSQRRTYAE